MSRSGSGDVFALLQASAVFAGLPVPEVEALAATAREQSCRAREYVFHEGDPALWLCLVKTGHVRIVRHSRAGKDVVLELLGPGEIFGGVAVIERRPYPAAAQTAEPSVVVKIPADVVVGLAERHPSVVREMALLIGRRLRAAHDSVKSLSVEPVESRLAATLLRLADREGVPHPGRGRAALSPDAAEPRRHVRDHRGDRDPRGEPVAPGRCRGRPWRQAGREGPRCPARPRRGGRRVVAPWTQLGSRRAERADGSRPLRRGVAMLPS